jgi:hypothetical protein
LNGLLSWEPAPAPPPSTEIDRPAVPEVVASAPIDW